MTDEPCWDYSEQIPPGAAVEPPAALPWRQAPPGPITEHFSWGEAACNHCGRIPDVASVEKTAEWLEEVRAALGNRPLIVNSWCRCPTHNANVGGALHSFHVKGWAVDIVADGLTPAQTHARLRTIQGKGKLVGGLGRYASFCHVDRGPARRWEGP